MEGIYCLEGKNSLQDRRKYIRSYSKNNSINNLNMNFMMKRNKKDY
jgi:hypothetical protein